MSDIGDSFDEAFAEVSEGGDSDTGDLNVPKNANVYMGDDDVSTETNDDDVSDDETGSGSSTEDNPQVFDWTSHKDDLVEVKVDGETIKVPLSEAIAGHMRQADYTRKTQRLAGDAAAIQWANDMREALRKDPAGTIRALQEHLGVAEGELDDPYGDLDPEVAPVVRAQDERLARIEQQEAYREQQAILAEVKQEIADVKAKYSDFDPQQVLPFAAQRGMAVEDAYLLLKARDLISNQSGAAEAAEAARLAAEEAAKTKRKNAAKVTNGGSNTKTVPSDEDDYIDFEDLLNRNLEKSR